MTKLINLSKTLTENDYPGRGIVVGLSEDGASAVLAYFIMGRSVNSRNRVFTSKDRGIITEAFDPSKLSDPSLIIYAPVKICGDTSIVTNGDQTDTIFKFLNSGDTFENALRTREFEPDYPNFTPRISAVASIKNGELFYKMSIIKSSLMRSASCERFFYEYQNPIAGEGRFIHTYKCDGDPIPSFEGEPEAVAIKGDINEFSNELWSALNGSNKVSLFVRYINIKTGKEETIITNKNV